MTRMDRPWAAARLPPRVAITGTDTGVGKTFVGAHVARAWKLAGRRVAVAKPVESGLGFSVGFESDAEMLARAADDPGPIAEISPYRFRAALAPTVAAAREGVEIDAGVVRRCVRHAVESGDAAVVEGAGGLLVPLAPGLTLRDIAIESDLPLLVVVGNRLGCVNHALLTVECARATGCRVCGLVLCTTDRREDESRATNGKLLAGLCDTPILFDLPYVDPEWFWPGLDDRARALVGPLLEGT